MRALRAAPACLWLVTAIWVTGCASRDTCGVNEIVTLEPVVVSPDDAYPTFRLRITDLDGNPLQGELPTPKVVFERSREDKTTPVDLTRTDSRGVLQPGSEFMEGLLGGDPTDADGIYEWTWTTGSLVLENWGSNPIGWYVTYADGLDQGGYTDDVGCKRSSEIAPFIREGGLDYTKCDLKSDGTCKER